MDRWVRVDKSARVVEGGGELCASIGSEVWDRREEKE